MTLKLNNNIKLEINTNDDSSINNITKPITTKFVNIRELERNILMSPKNFTLHLSRFENEQGYCQNTLQHIY